MGELETRYYLRLGVADRPGVLGQIARVLGDLSISIDAVAQHETDDVPGGTELILTTHRAKEASMQQAVRLLRGLDVVREVGILVRMADLN